MTRLPRRIGWLFMVVALAVGWGARGAGMTHYGPFPAAAVGLLVGGVGVLLVITDIMVRGIYTELHKAKANPPSEPAGPRDAAVGADCDDVAVGGDFDRT